MKIRSYLYVINILSILFFQNCKQQINENEKIEAKSTSNVPLNKVNENEELFIGKIFFSGDELDQYTFIKSGDLNKDDNLTYSIYKENGKNIFIFSVERLVSNIDQEEYEITDIFKFENYSAENTQIKLEQQNNENIVLLLQDNKVIKKWTFQQNKKATYWNGEYMGEFQRIRDEGDPRAMGQLYLKIRDKKAELKIDSYIENIKINLNVVNESDTEIKLTENNTNKSFILTKKMQKYILEGDLIDSIVGFNEKYEVDKIK